MMFVTKEELLIIILVVIIICAVLFVLIYLKSIMCNDYPRIINNNMNNINFKTGDVVSVSYSHMFGSFVSAWSASVVSHPGIIYKKNDGTIYVVEAAFYDKEYRHVVMVPLLKWLKYNKKHEIFYSKYSGPEISDLQMEETFQKFKKYKLEY
jgi:hypothetical protein